jgi:hypothetical protein
MFWKQGSQGAEAVRGMGLACAMGETGTVERQGTQDRPQDGVMCPLAVAEIATLRAVTLLAQIRLHLPLDDDLLERLEDGLAFGQ